MSTIKDLRFSLFALIALLLSACGEDENKPVVKVPSHSVLKISQAANENIINMNQHIDFADVSQGVVSREWIFPEEGTIMEGNPEDAQVRGVFPQVGEWEVTLHQEFENNAYVGTETTARETNVLDTTIIVTVMPAVQLQTIKANIVNLDGTLGDEVSMTPETPTEIPFGSVLRFTYTAEGNPTVVAGEFFGAELLEQSALDGTFDVKYVTLDATYDFAPVFTRPQPNSSDTLYVANFVKCVRSSVPLTLDKVVNDEDRKVNVIFSRGLNANSVNKEDFTVKITTAAGATLTPEVTAAAVNPQNESAVLLEIDGELIYTDDDVLVTYSGTELESQDAAIAPQFEDEELVHVEDDLLKASDYNYSFESSATSYVGGDPAWLGGFVPDILETSTAQATDGSSSLKISRGPFSGSGANASAISTYVAGAPHTFNFTENENNKLLMTYDVFVEANGGSPAAGSGGFETNVRIHLSNRGGDWQEAAHPFGSLDENQWYTFDNVISVNNPLDEFNLIIKVAHTGEETYVIYLDNIQLMRFYPRP
ncbi:hypothetical protein [Flammeovirga sp. SubArs3]|uniref:hypothetical protein n=1 Tax=Flammeovirga sp. SubArs3 TaxID=2995316 RepID=UPI00248A9C62|nr:hypothetical protein [Flammeovirga sp. SubArs3]